MFDLNHGLAWLALWAGRLLAGVFAVLALAWVLFKRCRSRQWPTVLETKIVLTTTLSLLALVGTAVFLERKLDPFAQRRFSTLEWKRIGLNPLGPREDRGQMVRSLREEVLRQGMSQREVRSLLGKPDFREGQDGRHHLNEAEAASVVASDHYNLGFLIGIDPEFLAIGYGADGRVVLVWTWQG